MAVLRKLGVLSVAKVQAVLMAVIGFIMGIFSAISGTIIGTLAGSAALGASLGLLSIVIFPVVYAFIGFVGGAISAFLYNLVAGWIGGIEMDFGK